jgi:hypothetical protein
MLCSLTQIIHWGITYLTTKCNGSVVDVDVMVEMILKHWKNWRIEASLGLACVFEEILACGIVVTTEWLMDRIWCKRLWSVTPLRQGPCTGGTRRTNTWCHWLDKPTWPSTGGSYCNADYGLMNVQNEKLPVKLCWSVVCCWVYGMCWFEIW